MREARGEAAREALRTRGLLIAITTWTLAGCGGATAAPGEGGYTPEPIDPPSFLLAYARAHDTPLQPPEGDLEALEAAREAAESPADRRVAMADLAVYHLLAAEQEEDAEDARASFRRAERWATTAARRNTDEALGERVDFVRLWVSWRTDRDNVATRVDRFTTEHTAPTDDVILAWLVRAELAFAREQWEEARAAYRYVLGQLGHPLYAYALLRSGEAHRNAGELDEAAQAFTEVRTLGCPATAAPETVKAAAVAAVELGERVELDATGTPRSEACAGLAPAGPTNGEDAPPPVQLD